MRHNNKRRFTAYFLLVLCLNTFVFPANLVLADGIVVKEGTGNANHYAAPNGVPVVDIATPTDKGLSHNRYSEFNVDSRGAVLNNSAAVAKSQLAGAIRVNENLTQGREANVILNEVVDPNKSRLEGYMEVHGKTADVVVANPYGIAADGAGFINTDRVTLTTGTPNAADGQLNGFSVDQGQLEVRGKGINATAQKVLNMVARNILLDAPVTLEREPDLGAGKNPDDVENGILNIVAGKADVDYETMKATAKGTEKNTAYGLDSSALGGMYAGRINIVSTDEGFGVNMRGDMAASADDITINANGEIVLNNQNSAQRDIIVKQTTSDPAGNGITLKEASLAAKNDITLETPQALSLTDGQLVAENNLTIQSDALNDSGEKENARSAGNQLSATINNEAKINGTSYLAGDSLTVTAGSVTVGEKSASLADGTKEDAADRNLSITAAKGDLNLGKADVQSSAGIEIKTAGDFKTDADESQKIAAQENVTLELAGDLTNKGDITAGKDLVITPVSTDETTHINEGNLQAEANIRIKGNVNLQNEADAVIAAKETLEIEVNSLENKEDGIILGSRQTEITAQQGVKNTGRLLLSEDESTSSKITAKSVENETGGVIQSAGELVADIVEGIKNAGEMLSGKKLSVKAVDLDNQETSTIQSGDDAELALTGKLTSNGKILSAGNLDVTADEFESAKETAVLQAGKSARLTITKEMAHTGTLSADETLEITADALSNTGSESVIRSGKEMTLEITKTITNEGTITSEGALTATGEAITNTGRIESAEDQTLTTGTVENADGGVITTNGVLTVESETVDNAGGLSAKGDMNATVTTLNNTGVILSKRSLTATGETMTNDTNGYISADGNLNLEYTTLTNDGTMVAKEMISAITDSLFNDDDGTVSADKDLNIDTDTLTNKGMLYSKTDLTTQAATTDNDGSIAADGDLTLNTEILLLNDEEFVDVGGNLNIYGNVVDVSSPTAMIRSSKALIINITDSFANNGMVTADDSISITANGITNFETGVIYAENGNVFLDSLDEYLTNYGHIEAGGGVTLKSDVKSITNIGTIAAIQDIFVTAPSIEVEAGKWLWSETGGLDLEATAGDLIVNGDLEAGAGIFLNAANGTVSNNGYTVAADNIEAAGQSIDLGQDGLYVSDEYVNLTADTNMLLAGDIGGTKGVRLDADSGTLLSTGIIQSQAGDVAIYKKDATFQSGSVVDAAGNITVTGDDGDMTVWNGAAFQTAKGDIVLNSNNITNNGDIIAMSDIQIDLLNKFSNTGVLQTETGDIFSGPLNAPWSFENFSGGEVFAGNKIHFRIFDFYNKSGGVVQSRYASTFELVDAFTNEGQFIASVEPTSGEALINAEAINNSNDAALFYSAGDLKLEANSTSGASIYNLGRLMSDGDLTVRTDGGIFNLNDQAIMQTLGVASFRSLDGQDEILKFYNHDGATVKFDAINAKIGTLINEADSHFQVNSGYGASGTGEDAYDLVLGSQFDNEGYFLLGTSVAETFGVRLPGLENTSTGTIASKGILSFLVDPGHTIINDGTITGQGSTSDSTIEFDTYTSGTMDFENNGTIDAYNLTLYNSVLTEDPNTEKGNANSGQINNYAGSIFKAKGTFESHFANIDNYNVMQANMFKIDGGDFYNHGQTSLVLGGGDLDFTGRFVNEGYVHSPSSLYIEADKLILTENSSMSAVHNLWLTFNPVQASDSLPGVLDSADYYVPDDNSATFPSDNPNYIKPPENDSGYYWVTRGMFFAGQQLRFYMNSASATGLDPFIIPPPGDASIESAGYILFDVPEFYNYNAVSAEGDVYITVNNGDLVNMYIDPNPEPPVEGQPEIPATGDQPDLTTAGVDSDGNGYSPLTKEQWARLGYHDVDPDLPYYYTSYSVGNVVDFNDAPDSVILDLSARKTTQTNETLRMDAAEYSIITTEYNSGDTIEYIFATYDQVSQQVKGFTILIDSATKSVGLITSLRGEGEDLRTNGDAIYYGSQSAWDLYSEFDNLIKNSVGVGANNINYLQITDQFGEIPGDPGQAAIPPSPGATTTSDVVSIVAGDTLRITMNSDGRLENNHAVFSAREIDLEGSGNTDFLNSGYFWAGSGGFDMSGFNDTTNGEDVGDAKSFSATPISQTGMADIGIDSIFGYDGSPDSSSGASTVTIDPVTGEVIGGLQVDDDGDDTQVPVETPKASAPVTIAEYFYEGGRTNIFTLLEFYAANPFLGVKIKTPSNPFGQFILASRSQQEYLIETNPIYGLDAPYLGSDYLIDRLVDTGMLSSDDVVKRIGDSLYEKKLIQEQLLAKANRPVLAGYGGSMQTQIEAMYENSLKLFKRWTENNYRNIQYGAPLSASDISALKEDVIWPVKKMVNGNLVTVPVVYLCQDTIKNIAENSDDAVIASEGNLDIASNTVTNQETGVIQTEDDAELNIQGFDSIENIGGTIKGGTVKLASANGNITNTTATRKIGDSKNFTTKIGRRGAITAAQSLDMRAGRDIKNIGADISSKGSANIIAGRDFVMDTIQDKTGTSTTTVKKEKIKDGERATTTTVTTNDVKQVGATLDVGGNLKVNADHDVTVAGSDVNAKGSAVITAAVNQTWVDREDTSVTDTNTDVLEKTKVTKKSGNIFTGIKKTTTTTVTETNTFEHDLTGTAKVSTVTTGGNLIRTAGDTLTDVGTKSKAGGTMVQKAGTINQLAATNRHENEKTEDTKISTESKTIGGGLLSGVIAGGSKSVEETHNHEVYDETTRDVAGASASNDFISISKEGSTFEGTDISAGGNATIKGESVDFTAAQGSYSSSKDTTSKYEQSSWSMSTGSVGLPIVPVGAGMSVSNGKGNAEYHGEASGTTAKTGSVSAGGNLSVSTTGGDLNFEGTGLNAGGNAYLKAEGGDINYTAATETHQENSTFHSESSSSGFGISAPSLDQNILTGANMNVSSSSKEADGNSTMNLVTRKTGTISAGNNVAAVADGSATFEGTDISAGGNAAVKAESIDFKAAMGSYSSTEDKTSKSSESSFAASTGVGLGPLATIGLSQVGVKSGGGFGLSSGKAESQGHEEKSGTTAETASISAGGSAALSTTNGDMNFEGTDIEAGENVYLNVEGGDLNYKAAQTTHHELSTFDSKSSLNKTGLGAAYNDHEMSAGASANAQASIAAGDYQASASASASANASATLAADGSVQDAKASAGVEATPEAGKSDDRVYGAEGSASASAEVNASMKINLFTNTNIETEKHTKDTEDSTTNLTGGINAGDNLVIKTNGGDALFEGTDLSAGGDTLLALDGGDLTMNAVHDEKETTSYSYEKTNTNSFSVGVKNEGSAKAEAGAEATAKVDGPVTNTGTASASASASANAQASSRLAIGNVNTREEKTSEESSFSSKAVVSDIKTGGNLLVNAGKASLEGTNMEAGENLVMNVDSLDYTAARDVTTTSSRSDYEKEEIGFELSAGGGAEAGASASASTEDGSETGGKAALNVQGGASFSRTKVEENATTDEHSDKAVVGSMKAGNNLVISSRGNASFEGTNMEAGDVVKLDSEEGMIDIKAAEDIYATSASAEKHSDSQSAGLDAKADVIGVGSLDQEASGSFGYGMENASEKTSEKTTTAVVSNIKSGKGVVITAKKDVNLEGTKIDTDGFALIDSSEGGVNIMAAEDTREATSESSSDSLDVSVSGSYSKSKSKSGSGSTSGSTGSTSGTGGTGSTSTSKGLEAGVGYAKSNATSSEKSTTAQVASINAKNGMSITGKGDVTLEGTELTSDMGGVHIDSEEGSTTLLAARDTFEDTGSSSGMSVEAGLSLSSSSTKGGSDAAGKKTEGDTSEKSAETGASAGYESSSYTEKGSTAKAVDIKANSDVYIGGKNDVLLEGTNISSQDGGVAIDSREGSTMITAAVDTYERTEKSFNVDAGVTLSGSKGSEESLPESKTTSGTGTTSGNTAGTTSNSANTQTDATSTTESAGQKGTAGQTGSSTTTNTQKKGGEANFSLGYSSSSESKTTAKAANISAGKGVSISAENNVTLVGTGIDAGGDVSIDSRAGETLMEKAVSTHTVKNFGIGLDLAGTAENEKSRTSGGKTGSKAGSSTNSGGKTDSNTAGEKAGSAETADAASDENGDEPEKTREFSANGSFNYKNDTDTEETGVTIKSGGKTTVDGKTFIPEATRKTLTQNKDKVADSFKNNPPATVEESIQTIKEITGVELNADQAARFLSDIGVNVNLAQK